MVQEDNHFRGPDVQMQLEFRSVGFCGGRKTGEPGEKPSLPGENQQQTQSARDDEYGESNPGHRDGTGASAYPLGHPCSQ